MRKLDKILDYLAICILYGKRIMNNISIIVGTVTMLAVLKTYFGLQKYMLVGLGILIVLFIILDAITLYGREMKKTGQLLGIDNGSISDTKTKKNNKRN